MSSSEDDLVQALNRVDTALAVTQLPCDCDEGGECYCLSYPTSEQIAQARSIIAEALGVHSGAFERGEAVSSTAKGAK